MLALTAAQTRHWRSVSALRNWNCSSFLFTYDGSENLTCVIGAKTHTHDFLALNSPLLQGFRPTYPSSSKLLGPRCMVQQGSSDLHSQRSCENTANYPRRHSALAEHVNILHPAAICGTELCHCFRHPLHLPSETQSHCVLSHHPSCERLESRAQSQESLQQGLLEFLHHLEPMKALMSSLDWSESPTGSCLNLHHAQTETEAGPTMGRT